MTSRLALLSSLLIGSFLCAGCTESSMFSGLRNPLADPEDEVVENVKEALRGADGHSKLIGDYITVRRGLQMYVVEGVGLVTNLNGKGTDDGPPYRDMILEDMRKLRFPRPEEFLSSPDTAIVLVRAYIPPLVRKGDPLDVEVRLPDGSGAGSLRGGTLLECTLTEVAYAPGKGHLKGKVLARAQGAILGANLGDGPSDDDFLRGTIPGGAVYVGDDRDLAVTLQREYSNYRMSTRIANRIGERFYERDRSGIQQKLADAKTHSRIDIQIHSQYRDNYPRYLQTIRHIAIRETAVEKNLRMQELAKQLQEGPTAMSAAIRLEAIGRDALPYLKSGLKSDSLEARFYAAEALCYLSNTSGVDVLREAIDKEPAFRVYGLAALSASRSPEAVVALQSLLQHDSLETCYGAFRAITTIDPNEPIVTPVKTNANFRLHLVDRDSRPFVHVTRRQKAEVVLFGADQMLNTPLVLRAGRSIIVRSSRAGDRLIVTLFQPGQPEERREIPPRLADLILTVDELGVRYPEVLQMLVEADAQGNLAGPLGIDELPKAGRIYTRPGSEGSATETPVGGGDVPNVYDTADHSESATVGPIDPEDDELSPEGLGDVGFTLE
ncbi:MAG: flagellar basal body P-ring protein FlgI [Planctomycetaceae bacterium]